MQRNATQRNATQRNATQRSRDVLLSQRNATRNATVDIKVPTGSRGLGFRLTGEQTKKVNDYKKRHNIPL
jgi:hypothetical protein